MLRRLGHDLRAASWKVNVTLEMRDWVYGTYLPPRLIRIYPSAFGQRSMGLAVDLGTTSVVAYLVDFSTAQVVDTASAYNKQISCGDDVISRIIYAQRDGGLGRLQRLDRWRRSTSFSTELQERNRVELYEIHEVAVAGNTTMTHLLLGLDPRYLRRGAVHTHCLSAAQAGRRRAGPARQRAGARARHAVRRQLRRRRHHRRRDLLGPVRHRQAHRVHRHRHQRRDGAGQQGLARRLRLLGRARLRGRRRELRHARHGRRHRGRLDRLAHAGADLPHGGRRRRRAASAAAA